MLDDLAAGRPMDRLICGDVGFGKTEVALRAAFVAAHGRQAGRGRRADDAPRPPALQDLLRALRRPAGQRRAGLAPGRRQGARRDQGAASPTARSTSSSAPTPSSARRSNSATSGSSIVDEEQHFGVKHKERLKELRADVHVLTLSATPIPRTLQLALTGVRELSLITTPPVDRLAVRTFVSPFDRWSCARRCCASAIAAARASMSARGSATSAEQRAFLAETVPEVKVAVAHGQMAAGELEDIMTAFYDGAIRRPPVDLDRRIRPRHPDRQHADRPSRRHVRPRPALSAARPRRPLQDPRLCAVHAAGGARADRARPSGG